MILALWNNKGGVGKTTAAVNLAAGLARHGKRVLLVDLDSQCSASISLGLGRGGESGNMADVLMGRGSLGAAIRATAMPMLDIAPGGPDLANADIALCDRRGRERVLQGALAGVVTRYDFTILDCPPSMSLIPINALLAADGIIVPVVPHYLALEGLVNLMAAVERIRVGMGSCASVMGILLTMVDGRAKAPARSPS